jgi:lipid-A-disaccharide synthase
LRGLVPQLEVFGLGGPRLRERGLKPVAEASALNVVGISEAVRSLGSIRGVFKKLKAQIEQKPPRAALLIDLPDFNLRLAKQLRRQSIPVVYYVAPQAWAWRKGRIRQLRRRVSRLCCIFPFEEDFFTRHGVACEFVGHPLCEMEFKPAQAVAGRIALLPGSRQREIERLLPPLAAAGRLLKQRHPELEFVIPRAPNISKFAISSRLEKAGLSATVIEGGARQAFTGARLGLVASGTATLEGAFSAVPMVVVYRVSRTTYGMVRPFYRLPHVCIVNILAGKQVLPELLQSAVNPERIAAEAEKLLEDGPARQEAIDSMQHVVASLGQTRPSVRVANCLAGFLQRENS